MRGGPVAEERVHERGADKGPKQILRTTPEEARQAFADFTQARFEAAIGLCFENYFDCFARVYDLIDGESGVNER
jgi:hypothetical protein